MNAYLKIAKDAPDLLLAIDSGIKAGLALYNDDGKLIWYTSHNYGNRSALKRAAQSLFNKHPNIAWLIVEGGGPVADIWVNQAKRFMVKIRQIDAQKWRNELFFKKERRTGIMAKQKADALARKMIAFSKLSPPKNLRHDTAEAILIGVWGLLDIGWIDELPSAIRK